MGSAAKKVLDQALALPEDERAEVASQLLASLDGDADPDWRSSWDAELERRVGEIDGDEVTTSTWDEVRAELQARR